MVQTGAASGDGRAPSQWRGAAARFSRASACGGSSAASSRPSSFAAQVGDRGDRGTLHHLAVHPDTVAALLLHAGASREYGHS